VRRRYEEARAVMNVEDSVGSNKTKRDKRQKRGDQRAHKKLSKESVKDYQSLDQL
jgi:hypothetical protein